MKKDYIPFTDIDNNLIEKAARRRSSLAEQHPLSFALIGTFGFVCTLYGFEKIIDNIDLLANNPWVLLLLGLVTLSATGLALRKLG